MKKFLSGLSEKITGLLSRFKEGNDGKVNFNRKTALAAAICAAALLILTLSVKLARAPGDTGETGGDEAQPPATETTEPEVPIDPSGFRLSAFDAALIAYLCDNGYDSESFLISPAALRAAVCLAAAGAQGNTCTELATVAGFSGMDAFNGWYSGLNGSAAFRVQNSIWTNEDLIGPFTASYEADMKEKYDADAFSYKSDEITQALNDWMSEKTDGAPPAVTQDLSGMSTALVNTLSLRAAWREPFPEGAAYEGTFTGVDGTERTLDFMERTGEYYYVEENGVKAVVIPLEEGLSFVCFTGNRTGRFDKVAELKRETVHVVLPRFSLTSAFDGKDLVSFLMWQGVSEAINPRTANFYNMCQGSDWFVQEIIQELRFETSEEGVGIAASGDTAGTAGSAQDDGVKQFVVDGPCSFAIFTGFGTDSQYMLLYGQMMQ